ncbi:hypothetical protein ADUPG1_011135, partial [Aduncisulcus paluster]
MSQSTPETEKVRVKMKDKYQVKIVDVDKGRPTKRSIKNLLSYFSEREIFSVDICNDDGEVCVGIAKKGCGPDEFFIIGKDNKFCKTLAKDIVKHKYIERAEYTSLDGTVHSFPKATSAADLDRFVRKLQKENTRLK